MQSKRKFVMAFVGTAMAACVTARADIDYDFNSGAGVNRFGFKSTIPSSSIPPSDNSIPNTSFTSTDNSNVASSDNSRQTSTASGSTIRAASRFVFSINEAPASLTAVTVTWEGLSSSGETVRVYLWNANTATYVLVGTTTTSSAPDAIISSTFTVNPGHYIDSLSQLTVLALNADQNGDVLTDFLRVSLRQCSTNAECSDDNVCTNDICSSGACSHSNNTASCSDGNACTVGDSCSAGSCHSGSAPDCSNAGDQCNTASCDPSGLEGNCSIQTPRPNGTTCNDDLFCTVNDVCTGGVCSGDAKDCSSSSDQCNTGVCDEDADSCTAEPVADGTGCDDGLYCSVNDACTSGVCGGSDRDCSQSADQCNSASCNEDANECLPVPLPDGTGCEDGQFCTVADSCTAGLCGGTPRDCSGHSDQCHNGTCDEEANECMATPLADGSSCDDELYCTVDDACQNGICEGSPRDCSAQSDQCNAGLCNESLDACLAQPLPDQTACDDSNACTVGDSCLSGQCASGDAVDCSGLNGPCTVASCNPSGNSANCDVISPVEDGTSCDDGAYCTSGESCLLGECQGGSMPCGDGLYCDEGANACVECIEAAHCDDGVSCTDDACESHVCVHRANDELCPDNELYCDGVEYCDAELGCVHTGGPCPPGEFCDEATDSCGDCLVDADCNDSVPCTVDSCVSGGCVYTPDDGLCQDDGYHCNGLEYCDAAEGCLSAGDPCKEGSYCNEEANSCDECLVDDHCDDGDPCTISHACVSGACTAGLPVDCSNSGSACTVASCDPSGAPGNCDILTPVADGTSCDDGAFCTVEDACMKGLCAGSLRSCDHESNQCNQGVCDEDADACRPLPVDDGASCTDSMFCTIGDVCVNGTCLGTPRDCSFADDQCNAGTCDEDANACVAQPFEDGTSCDDELFCTQGDACIKGVCHGESRSCDEFANQCNSALCNEEMDECMVLPADDGTTCDDGLYCTVGDACAAGVCQGGPRDCGDSEACTFLVCVEESQSCEVQLEDDGTSCDDGDACTDNDSCQSGVCSGSRSLGLEQWAALYECLAGPDQSLESNCECMDLDSDGDVDLVDIGEFMQQFTGQ